jgi:hypothetical protein
MNTDAVLAADRLGLSQQAVSKRIAVRAAVESVQPRTRPLRVDVLSRIGGPVELVRRF